MKFGRKPYLIKVEGLDTASADDIENKSAGLKVVKTEKNGFILPGLLPPEVFERVTSINDCVGEITFQGEGNVKVTTERLNGRGVVNIQGLPQTFYPTVKSAFTREKELWFNKANKQENQDVLGLNFGVSRASDVQVFVTGKVLFENITSFTPVLSIASNTYELPDITSDCFSMVYLFCHIVTNPLITANLQVRANSGEGRAGKISFQNVSMVLTTLPRALHR